jgi:hypothetical protein
MIRKMLFLIFFRVDNIFKLVSMIRKIHKIAEENELPEEMSKSRICMFRHYMQWYIIMMNK